MTELIILVILMVIILFVRYYDQTTDREVIEDKPAETPTPAVDNTTKFSPPVHELEQWIKDNWKKIKVIPNQKVYEDESQVPSWTIESEVYTGQIVNIMFMTGRYIASGSGLDFDEVTYLKCVYEDILHKRAFKLRKIKDQRNRKQLARKLQQLGYGSGEYESK